MAVILKHAQYPDTYRRDWVQHSEHRSARVAVAHVLKLYEGKRNWWFQVSDDGFEVYSSDHHIAGLPIPR